MKLAVFEVASEQAELPHVVGDVFANVADGAVGADDYFLVFLGNSCQARGPDVREERIRTRRPPFSTSRD